jgi:hypothetical protein
MMGEDFSESVGDHFSESGDDNISEWMGGFPRNQHATRSKSWSSRTRISGNWQASTLLRKLNARDYAGATAQLDLRDRAGGQWSNPLELIHL